jgi:hypothetical protein
MGALTKLFGDGYGPAVAKVLDIANIVGNMEQTVPMLAEGAHLRETETSAVVNRLLKYGLIRESGWMGLRKAYRFNVESSLRHLIHFTTQMRLRK